MNTEESVNEAGSTESYNEIELDGEAWKERDNTTYTSILDIYGVPELFSENSTDFYHNNKNISNKKEQELIDYVLSDDFTDETKTNKDEELVEYIFSKEVSTSKVKEYSKDKEDYASMTLMAVVFVIFAFGLFMVRFNIKRQNRREKYGIEINMED